MPRGGSHGDAEEHSRGTQTQLWIPEKIESIYAACRRTGSSFPDLEIRVRGKKSLLEERRTRAGAGRREYKRERERERVPMCPCTAYLGHSKGCAGVKCKKENRKRLQDFILLALKGH